MQPSVTGLGLSAIVDFWNSGSSEQRPRIHPRCTTAGVRANPQGMYLGLGLGLELGFYSSYHQEDTSLGEGVIVWGKGFVLDPLHSTLSLHY